ncbi:MAG: phage/plasmid replication protein, II/X family [Candidatus Saccharimonadales bacterium]
MIDMLVLRCPIQQKFQTTYNERGIPVITEIQRDHLKLSDLKIPLEASLDVDGEQLGTVHRWEKIPSSYAHMAFKVFDFRGSSNQDMQDFYIEIKASPAKLMQGHNLYGTDALGPCAYFMIELLYKTYPDLADYLEPKYWSVEQVDITYHSWCKTENEALQLVTALQNVSNGQTRARTGYSGTVYFGKSNSRIKKIKVYVKLLEVLNYLATVKRSGDKKGVLSIYTDTLLEWAKGMVRWEASLKTRWFQRRGISNNLIELCKVFDAQTYWKESTQDIFKALEGKAMRIIKDENIEQQLKEKFPTVNARSGKITYGKAMSAYRVYRSIKTEGWIEAKRSTSYGAFYSAVEMLHECGLSKAVLQNLQGDGLKCEVIPFIRYIEINFNEQFPAFAKEAA